jgi:hypothetical protein
MSNIFLPLNLLDFYIEFLYAICCKIGNCNMSVKRDSGTFKQLEATLLEEIADLSAKIRDLLNQKDAAERLLIRARQQNLLVRRSDVTRKNSINRILVEGAIVQSIERANGPVSAWNLYKDARLMVPQLKENTFRSYLFRMKERGLLTSVNTGLWQITPQQGERRVS